MLPEQTNIDSLQIVLEDALNDDDASQAKISIVTKKLKEVYKEEEVYWRQKVVNYG